MADDDKTPPFSDGDEISSLKEALCAQQFLLQKLYNELDAEREASASAASEALAVILRLQGEKAAVKMEAEHYKRLSEEKIFHAEESMAVIEDAMYQKEMEVAALDYQVQAYRYKLLSMGCVDHGFGGAKFLDGFLQRDEVSAMESGGGSIGRRNSAPISVSRKRPSSEGDGCRVQEKDLEGKLGEQVCEKGLDSEKKIDSYREKIKRLDERVKEIAGAKFMNSRIETQSSSSSSSLPSRVRRGSSCDASISARNEEDSLHEPKKLSIVEGIDEAKSPTSIHDVFEVPQAEKKSKSCESMARDEVSGKRSVEREEAVCEDGDESEWLKRVLKSSGFEKKSCRLVVVPLASSVSQLCPAMNGVDGRSEIVEDERSVECSRREEELRVLNEIKEKVNCLHDEIRSLKEKKSSSKREEPISIREEESSLAMALHSEVLTYSLSLSLSYLLMSNVA